MRVPFTSFAIVLVSVGFAWAQEPPPDWVRVGTRLTYHGMGSNIETVNRLYGPDDLQNFTPTPDWLRRGNNAWEGLQQLNVVALTKDQVLLSVRRYVMVRAGTPALFEGSSDLQPIGTAGEYWRHPDVLRRALASPPAGMLAARMPITINGVTYQGIQFGVRSDTGQMIHVFDEKTGVLLRTGTISQSRAFKQNPLTGEMTYMWECRSSGLTLAERTQVDWPWAESQPPDWIQTVRSLRYEGMSVLQPPGSPPYQLAISIQMDTAQRGKDWLEHRTTIRKAGIPPLPGETAVVKLASGRAQLGGAFLPPERLANLRPGQVLDRDSFTRTEVMVVSHQDNMQGQPILAIRETGPTQRFEYRYNTRSGMLVGYSRDDQHAFTRTNVNLVE